MYMWETPGLQANSSFNGSEVTFKVNYSLSQISVEELWVSLYQEQAEKYKPKSIQWYVLKNTNEMVLANCGTVSTSSEVGP